MPSSAGLGKGVDGGPPPAMTNSTDRASIEAVILPRILTSRAELAFPHTGHHFIPSG